MTITDKIKTDRKISPEEEIELWESFWNNSQDADLRMKLVELYLPLVISIANKLPLSIRQKSRIDELIGAGVIGLHDAISAYSKDKNVMFSTFAYKRIRGSIIDELRDQDHLTRTQRNYYKEICAAINKLTIELARPPTDNEIAEFTNLTVGEVDKYIGMGSEVVSLYQEFEDGLSYQDVIADNVTLSPLESAHNSMAIEKLREYFRELDEREQKILFLRHYEDMSVKEIAKVLEISEGRISQLYQKTVLKLRAFMNVS